MEAAPCRFVGRQRQRLEHLPRRRQLLDPDRVAPRPFAADQAGRDADRRQPLVGIVGAQQQPVLGARREHPIGLGDPAA